MKPVFHVVMVFLILLSAGIAWAHLPADVTYYAFQFPDPLLPTLDGDLSDWDIVPPAYVYTTEDMYEQLAGMGKGGAGVDLADLALKTIVGWNESTNRLYFMSEVFDDIHQTDRADPKCNWTDDCWELMIDADHSGGRYTWFSDLTEEEKKRLTQSHAQHPILAVPPVQDVDFTLSTAAKWYFDKEYVDYGWSFTGDEFGESTYYYEVMLPGWDDLNWEGPEVSKMHDFEEGEIIGLGLAWGDFDELSDSYDAYWTISGGDATCGLAEALADFYLAPIEPSLEAVVTAIEGETWGRIKSTFAE